MKGQTNHSTGAGVVGAARWACFTSQAGTSCLGPGGHWERGRRRPSRSRHRLGKTSAGLIGPRGSPGKLGERDGALLQ